MSCEASNNNATAPSPAIAPGAPASPGSPARPPAAALDPRAIAEDLVARFGASPRNGGGMDPRVRALVPDFDAPYFQAGLAGYSDAAMRLIARRHGCPFCVTEALLDRTLLAGGRGFAKADLGELSDNVPGGAEDSPLACQIMGSDPREMAAAALKAVEQHKGHDAHYRALAYAGRTDIEFARDVTNQHLRLPGGVQIGRMNPGAIGSGQSAIGNHAAAPAPLPITHCPLPSSSAPLPIADCRLPASSPPSFSTIDVNLACPVKKISSKARGGHWLAEPDGAVAILQAVRDALPAHIPVTVKMRRSFDDTPQMVDNFHRIFDAAYDMGCAWVTVHGRTVEQKYVGPSRWEPIRDLVARVNRRWPDRVVFGSGDVWQAADIFRMIAYTGVAGASVARGCIGNPWIFRQARDMLEGRPPAPPTIAEQRAVLLEHFDLALAVNQRFRHAEVFTGKTMRKFAIRFAEHHPQADAVRTRFIRVSTTEEWRAVVDEFYTETPTT